MKFFFKRNAPVSLAPLAEASFDSLIARGNQLEDAGQLDEAREIYERAVSLAPKAPQGHLNLGNALLLAGQFEEAADCYRRAIRLRPEHAGTHLNLGNALMSLGTFDSAADCYRTALQFHPGWSEAWFGLGCALERSQALNIDAAADAYRQALRLHPEDGKAASNLAALLRKHGRTAEAQTLLESVIAKNSKCIPALLANAVLHKELGDPEVSVAAYRRVLAISPEDAASNSDYLFMLNFVPDVTAEVILAEHCRYGELLARRTPRCNPRDATDPGKQLKIGYVSPDFRRHPVSCFIEPLLQNHDRRYFEIFCYYNHADGDEITERIRNTAGHWRDIFQMTDDSVARRIVADGIDILVDLAGHTAENRLGVFARKPAPVQCTWLGYLSTTGLSSIDYRLCDAHTDPAPEAESWQIEKPLRLPDSQWCYQPPTSLPASSPLPRLKNGYWTFGSLNQGSKLNFGCLRMWGELLNEIPHSRLRFLGITDSLLAERIRINLAEQGVAAERIDMVGRLLIDDYFSCYRDIDVALDTFPYNGATTTCDALVMGVPVATVAGNRSIARGGVSLLTTIDLQNWIAPTANEFVDMLREQTRDPMRVAALRAELPQRMRASRLMDAVKFTRNLEIAYRNIWQSACAQAR